MLIVIGRDELLRALAPVSGVPSTKSGVPILTNLVLNASRDGGTVRGTNMEIDITYRYLLTVLQAYTGGTVELRYASVGDPMMLSLAGSDVSLQLLMPMPVGGEQLEEAA